jgi:hypothetical protein
MVRPSDAPFLDDVPCYVNLIIPGEALLISSATIGPLMYTLFKDYEKKQDGFSKPFPGSRIYGIIIVIICLVSASIFGMRGGSGTVASFSQNALWLVSLVVAVISFVIWFIVVSTKNSLEDAAPQVMRQDTKDFLKEWNNE